MIVRSIGASTLSQLMRMDSCHTRQTQRRAPHLAGVRLTGQHRGRPGVTASISPDP
jgi:hypothetical protein